MAKFRVTGPDGGTYEINAPDGASEEQVLNYAKMNLKGKADFQPASDLVQDQKITAPSSSVAMGLRDPVDALAQIARRVVPEGIGQKIDQFGNYLADLGLPVTKSNGVAGVDQIVSDVNKKYEQSRGEDTGFDYGRLAGNIINPVNAIPGVALAKGASTVGSLAARGAAAGAIGGLLQPVVNDAEDNFAGKKTGQALASAITGAVTTPVVAKGAEKISSMAGNFINKFRPQPPQPNADVAMNNVFSSQGINPTELSDIVKNSVRSQIEQALANKTKIEPAEIIRKAQFEAVGLSGDAAPTAGQLSRDPMQFAKEKNLSGLNINGENGLSSRFQAQNQALQGVFDQAGANNATDRVTAGQSILNALRQTDVPVKEGVNNLYEKARGMSAGRVADLDRAAFSNAANTSLDEGMYNSFVPSNVRNLLNDITAGKGPFNVESAVQIDSLLSRAQRQAERQGDAAGASAIGIIRTKLHDTPFAQQASNVADNTAQPMQQAASDAARTVEEAFSDVPFREMHNQQIGGVPRLPAPEQTGLSIPDKPQYSRIEYPVGQAAPPEVDDGQAARQAFEEARRAARSRFATIEETPALKAALDDGAPDKFVQQFILGANVRDVDAMNNILQNNPEAKAQARAQVADYLKRAAFGENPSGDKAFSADRYLRTLSALGPQKLALFFNPEEVVKLNLAGKVASDINSIPVGARYGTNTSGTAAAVGNAILGVLDKVPGGGVLGVPLNFVKREVGNYQTQKAINSALNPSAQPLSEAGANLSPELIRAFQSLGIAGGLGAGATIGSGIGN